MRKDELRDKTRQDLLEIARALGVKGRNAMNKDDLVSAIISAGPADNAPAAPSAGSAKPDGARPEGARFGAEKTTSYGDGRDSGGRRPPQARAPMPHPEDVQEDEQNWNSVDLGKDPNYGRFLNPGGASQARDGLRPGPNRGRSVGPTRSETLAERSERGRLRASAGPQNGQRDDPRRGSDRYRGLPSRGQSSVRRTERNERGPRRGYRDQTGSARSDRGSRDSRGYSPDHQRGGRDRDITSGRSGAGRSYGAPSPGGRPQIRGSRPLPSDPAETEIGRIPADADVLAGAEAAIPDNGAVYSPGDLSESYGVDRCNVMVGDPGTLHVQWEIGQHAEERAHRELGEAWGGHQRILRVHSFPVRKEPGMTPAGFFDVEIQPETSSAYVEVPEADRGYRVDIGLINQENLFYPMASSTAVVSPGNGDSPVSDEQWMDVRADGAGVHFGEGPSADEVALDDGGHTRLVPPPVVHESASGIAAGEGRGARAAGVRRKRDFRFELNTELVVFGSTEPDARVTMQGKPIEVRSDGTFTVRFLLPDGTQKIEVAARSADGVERRVITPIVSRATRQETGDA